MANVTRGHTYGVNDEVTNTNLHSLVDAATVSAIVSADFTLTTTNPIHIGSSAPSDADQRFWYDTTNNLFLVKDAGSTFQPTGRGFEYTNKSGDSLAAGDVVILDTANAEAVKTTTTASDTDAWGVVANTSANDAVVYVITEGIVPALTVDGATAIGDYLFTSTTVKKATAGSAVASGAFARALTSSSSSVVAQLLGGGAAVSIPGSETFEMEAGREATASTTFGSPTTVTFGTAFAKAPVVVCTPESVTASQEVIVVETSTTNFKVYGVAAVPFNWVACTAGTYEVSTGVVVQAGTATNITGATGQLVAYQTGETPAIVLGGQATDNAAPSANSWGIANRLFGTSTSANINNAGRSSSVAVIGDSTGSAECPAFILFSQTSAVKTGNGATADGTQGTINTLSYESGTLIEVTSVTPTLTFQTAFSAAPAVIVSGESRDVALAAGNWPANLNATPSTTAITARITSVDGRTGYNWIAVEKGHTTVTTAKRLG